MINNTSLRVTKSFNLSPRSLNMIPCVVMARSRPRFILCSHSLVRRKNNVYFLGIQPQPKKDLFKVCVV